MAGKTGGKQIAVIGLGNRGLGTFAKGIVGFPNVGLPQFREVAHLRAVAETNPQRAKVALEELGEYRPADLRVFTSLDELLDYGGYDLVVVATPDHTHRDIVLRCFEAGYDVLCEKPMATTAAHCREMAEAARKAGRELRIAFNARYGPLHITMKKLLQWGLIGNVLQVTYTEALSAGHGGDYFHRWHRRKANSGGLLIHKATHQFDIINYLLADEPVRVCAFGGLLYYKERPIKERGVRCSECDKALTCPHFFDLAHIWGGFYKRMYLEAERHDGYLRDRCVWDGEADIEDTVSVTIDYRRGAKVSYSLVAYAPKEVHEVMITGDKGRLLVAGAEDTIEVRTIEGETYQVRPGRSGAGGHGGSDINILKSVLLGVEPGVEARAGPRDGLLSVAIGDAANHSLAQGRVVTIEEVIAG